MRGMKVYIWGTGDLAEDYLRKQEIAAESILGFIETVKSKDMFFGKRVYKPDEIIGNDNYDYILVCVWNAGREICQVCQKVGINIDRLILVDNWEWINHDPMKKYPERCCKKITDNNIDIQKLLPQLYKSYIKEAEIQADRYLIISRNGYDLCEKDMLMFSESFGGVEYKTDYFRYRTFELMANEIIRKNIKGNVAELGVFKGMFSRLINAKFNDRLLYLFDTFNSFNPDEFEAEWKAGRVPDDFLEGFKSTDEIAVLNSMPYPDMCEVRKGLFPETAKGLEDEKYAFVSIDVDFEISILEGLRYFYPRMNTGGAIFVHDYNNRFLEGVKMAIDNYEMETGMLLLKVPLADEGGTLVILK